ncbi:MAG: hypothetical protein H6710_17275 [Myxococcales bacterium]|nr:hypothetical protein [Myxococcales bacterium]
MSEGSEGSEGSAIDELARAIDRGVFALEELRGALGDPGDPRHHLALVALDRRSAAAEEAAILRACAALLPAASADEPASAALLALLYRRLWRFLPAPRLPPWPGRVGDPSARAAWLRTEACVRPSALADADADADDPALAEALAGIELDEVDDPAALLEALAGRREEAAQACAARLLAVACERGRAPPAQAHGLARGLLRRGSPRVALAALARSPRHGPWDRIFKPAS